MKLLDFHKKNRMKLSLKGKHFLQDFLNTSTIHGLNHLGHTKIHIIEWILWLTLVISAIYGAVSLSSITLTRYNSNPTVISMERDRFAWNTSFPAATICPMVKYDEETLENYIETSNAPNKTLFRNFVVSLLEANYQNLEDVVDYTNGVPPEEFLDLILKLKMKFSPSEISNSAGFSKVNYLTEIVSEIGICYCFNSQLAVYNSARYWSSGQWTIYPLNDTLYVNPLDGEVFANVMNISSGFDIYIHGPQEVADVATKKTHSEDGYFLQLYLNGMTLFSSDKVRALKVKQRKCRFYDESDLGHSPVYSYVLCRMECRIRLSKQFCGCVPHFYRKLDGEKTCSVEGLHCLSKFKEKLILLEGTCSCLPNCDEVVYYVDDLDTREWFLGTNLQWGLKDYPKMRLKRDVIFGFTDLLVYIGGMAGLFLGCSVLSFIEIIYFFSLRIFFYFMKSEKQQGKIMKK
ncbi:sodium channel protein Nach-like [Harmonia axyridis]|uniref:sodium channel protein Nach-like n=1 Tax=Harmonia axyridis TaxID=115357 RepID=UPI001E276C01|nr:sodium channel protein Nach-like [Harmonia axyridis]